MRALRLWMVLAIMTSLFFTSCVDAEQRKNAERLMEEAYNAKNYNRLMLLADSLEQAGSLSSTKANYWRGYACDRLKQQEKAVAYWTKAMEEAEKSGKKSDQDYYVKAASRLANLLCLSGDYEGTLKMAVPVVQKLEEQQRDTTSDYVNLLIYIGLCQAGQSSDDADNGFFRACKKHRETIDRNHSDEAYKDAIAGLINIAYYCVHAKKYEDALYYTRNFGELVGEYEQRPGISADYVDRQIGRYDIYKAQALSKLGRKEEAEKVYEAFLDTKFSQSPEGKKLSASYLLETE